MSLGEAKNKGTLALNERVCDKNRPQSVGRRSADTAEAVAVRIDTGGNSGKLVESLQPPPRTENESEIDTKGRRDSFHFIVDYYGLTHRMCKTADHRALQV